MTCCSYPYPHVHYPGWLRMGDSIQRCRCGEHEWRISVEALLQAWKAGHP